MASPSPRGRLQELEAQRPTQNPEITVFGALRRGPPFHGSQSSREIKIQNESRQMAGREVTR